MLRRRSDRSLFKMAVLLAVLNIAGLLYVVYLSPLIVKFVQMVDQVESSLKRDSIKM